MSEAVVLQAALNEVNKAIGDLKIVLEPSRVITGEAIKTEAFDTAGIYQRKYSGGDFGREPAEVRAWDQLLPLGIARERIQHLQQIAKDIKS
jgi:hypothetical protein